jgi:hypothetical protein
LQGRLQHLQQQMPPGQWGPGPPPGHPANLMMGPHPPPGHPGHPGMIPGPPNIQVHIFPITTASVNKSAAAAAGSRTRKRVSSY